MFQPKARFVAFIEVYTPGFTVNTSISTSAVDEDEVYLPSDEEVDKRKRHVKIKREVC